MTLKDLITRFRRNLRDGTTCPVCDRYAKTYKRKLNSGMALALIDMIKKSGPEQEWVNSLDLEPIAGRPGGGDFAKLRYWDLIEARPVIGQSKRDSGEWRPTPKGVMFAGCGLLVPKYVLVYDGDPMGFEGGLINIREALGANFDYEELMTA